MVNQNVAIVYTGGNKQAWGQVHLKVLKQEFFQVHASTSTPAEIKSMLKYCQIRT